MSQEDDRSDDNDDRGEKASLSDRDDDDRHGKGTNKEEDNKERFRQGGESQPTCSLLVRNLSFNVRAEDIRQMMQRCVLEYLVAYSNILLT